jgi:hypothetical protein
VDLLAAGGSQARLCNHHQPPATLLLLPDCQHSRQLLLWQHEQGALLLLEGLHVLLVLLRETGVGSLLLLQANRTRLLHELRNGRHSGVCRGLHHKHKGAEAICTAQRSRAQRSTVFAERFNQRL